MDFLFVHLGDEPSRPCDNYNIHKLKWNRMV